MWLSKEEVANWSFLSKEDTLNQANLFYKKTYVQSVIVSWPSWASIEMPKKETKWASHLL